MGITSNPSNFSSTGKKKSKRGAEGGKKKRGGRNEATLEKGGRNGPSGNRVRVEWAWAARGVPASGVVGRLVAARVNPVDNFRTLSRRKKRPRSFSFFLATVSRPCLSLAMMNLR